MNQLPFLSHKIVNGSHGRLIGLLGWLFRFVTAFITAFITVSVAIAFRFFTAVSITLFAALFAVSIFLLLLAKRAVEEDKTHQCRVFIHRLRGDGRPGVLPVMRGGNQGPLAHILGEHSLHDIRQLGQDLGIHVRVVYPAVGCPDGDCARVIKRTNPAHLHDGHLAIFRHRKLRRGKLECRVVIPNTKRRGALPGHRPTSRDIGEV